MPALTIMIVDEHWANIPVYKRLVSEFPKSHVICFPDVHGAYHECALHAPDILLIDDEVPNIDPIAFARDLRKLAGVHEPLIVLIGSREGPLAENSRCGGIDVFLPKPVDTKFFMAMLYQAVKLRAARIDLIATRALA